MRLLFITLIFLGDTVFPQNANQLIGTWRLEKIAYKNVSATSKSSKEQITKVITAAIRQQTDTKNELGKAKHKQVNKQINHFFDHFNERTIDFREDDTFYSRSKTLIYTTSGTYSLQQNSLLMDWEIGAKNNFDVLKNVSNELVLKDMASEVEYHYVKLGKREVDEISARLKRAKELACAPPDKERVEAQKKAAAKLKKTKYA
jgi:hypothetical protein